MTRVTPLFHTLKIIAVAWMMISAYTFRMVDPWMVGALALLMGVLTLRLALHKGEYPAPAVWGAGRIIPPLKLNSLLVALGIMCLLFVTLISGHLIASPYLNTHVQYVGWFLGIVLLAMGFAGVRFPASTRVRPSRRQSPAETLRRKRLYSPTLIFIAGITVFAFILRAWRLDTAIHYFIDEMNFARAVWAISYAGPLPLTAPFSDVTAFTWIYPYWQWWAVQIYGYDLMALRIISAIIGTLTIPGVYLLGWELFDWRVGAVAALLLAVFPPHVHFSRIGINNIADPFFGVWMLVFLVRGLKYQRQRDVVLAGVMLGLTQYFYEGGRVVYPLLVLVWLEVSTLLRLIRMDRRVTQRVGIMTLTAVLIALPVYYVLVVQDEPVFQRFETEGIGGSYHQALREYDRAQPLEAHLTWPFLIYVNITDLSLFYGGEEPLLLFYIVPFYLLGLALAVWRWRDPAMLLLLIWVVGISAGNALLVH